jgi:FtsZ-binding cell division protein ZapB
MTLFGENPLKKNRENDDDVATTATNEEGEILSRLSERVERAVSMIQDLRRERDVLRARVDELESRVQDRDALEEEHTRFQKERSEIRDRIEGILGSLEALEAGEE